MDLKELELQFNKVLSYSQDIDIEKLNTSEIISKWASAKEKYIDLFGGNLIYECPKTIIFNLSPEERKERLKQFCHYIAITYSNDNLIDFIQDQEDSFFENKVFTTYHHNGKVIFKGSKLIKAFKYFEKNPLILDDI